MMFQLLPLVLGLTLFGVTRAYYIDQECELIAGKPLKAAMNAAFNRIELAQRELAKVIDNGGNEHIYDLAELLYDFDDLSAIEQQLGGALAVRNEEELIPLDQMNEDNLIVLCDDDVSQFATVNVDDGNGGVTQEYADLRHGHTIHQKLIEDCFTVEGTEAVTAVRRTGYPSVLYICPWYLQEEILNRENAEEFFNNDKQPRNYLELSNEDLERLDRLEKIPADLANDFVGMLTHEISHTKAGGHTLDSIDRDGTIPEDRNDAYGWENCVNMKNPWSADTRAFLCAMINIIFHSPQKPTEDGGFEPIEDWVAPT